jgi:hypothetical protein
MKKKKSRVTIPLQSEYNSYANLSDSQLNAATVNAAESFYNWNASQLAPLTSDGHVGDGTSNLPVNAPHLVAMMAAAILLDPGTVKAELKLIKNICTGKIGKTIIGRTGLKLAQITVRAGEGLMVRLGCKAAAKALTAASTRLATSLAARGAVAASTGPAAPFVLIAEFAFQATLGFLDQFGVGGYTDLVPSTVYTGMRDEYDRFYRQNVLDEGYEWPMITGPLDKLSQTDYESKISDAYDSIFENTTHPATQLFLSLYTAKRTQLGRTLTESEVTELLQTQGVGKAIDDAAFRMVAEAAGGKVVQSATGNLYCSYTTEQATDASYHWPLTSEYENDIYSEWNPDTQQSEARQSAVRTLAESLGNGCTYNKVTRVPNITEQYCRGNGLDYRNGECAFSNGQEIAEMIFGKTFVRGLTQVFDPDQYKECSDMDWCYEMNSDGTRGDFKCEDTPDVFELSLGYFCRKQQFSFSRTPHDMRCKTGYYQSSPGFCKVQCDTDTTGSLAGRQWKAYGGICYHPDVDTSKLLKVPSLRPCSDFGSNLRDDGTSCWSKVGWNDHCVNWGLYWTGCATGGGMVKNVTDREGCPTGYTHVPGSCRATSRPFDPNVYSIGDKGECPPEHPEREGLLCYDPCPENYTKLPGGLMCEPNGGPKLQVKVRDRKAAYSTPDFQNSPVGQRVSQIQSAANDGDWGRLASGMACLGLATNPFVNGLGLQDLTNMIPDPATGQGVSQT